MSLSLSIVSNNVYGQVNTTTSQSKHSPEYGINRVNKYTGGVNIDIPLYSIKSFIDIPIVVQYVGNHGIKVSEYASWIGLGWDLHPECYVTRNSRGGADEYINPYCNSKIKETNGFRNNGGYVNLSTYDKAYLNDQEPDLYHFTTYKRSGAFYVDKTGNVIQIPISNVKIIIKEKKFEIIETDGSRYLYEDISTSQSSKHFPSNVSSTKLETYKWSLSSIYSYNKTDSIKFSYKSIRTTEFYYENVSTPCFYDDKLVHPKIVEGKEEKILNSIEWAEGKLDFILNNKKRLDKNGAVSLDYIALSQKKHEMTPHYFRPQVDDLIAPVSNQEIITFKKIKTFEFNYNYFKTDSFCADIELRENIDKGSAVRLKLNKIDLYGSSHTDSDSYEFDYNTEYDMPSRDSYSVDSWGYFNGKNNTKLCPISIICGSLDKDYNRDTDGEFSDTYMINRIKYPTGGYTKFEFESNTVDKKEFQSKDFIGVINTKNNTDVEVGGLRIYRISNFNGKNYQTIRTYRYDIDGSYKLLNGSHNIDCSKTSEGNIPIYVSGSSSGVLSQVPIYVFLKNYYKTTRSPAVYRSNNPIYQLGSVGYSKVTEYQKGNGRTEYYYSTAKEFPDDVFCNVLTDKYSCKINTSFGLHSSENKHVLYRYPFPEKQSNEQFRGLLLSTKIYREDTPNSFTLVKEINNKYNCFGIPNHSSFSNPALIFIDRYFKTNMFDNICKQIIGQRYIKFSPVHKYGYSYELNTGIVLKESSKIINYLNEKKYETVETYKYNNRAQLISSKTSNGNNSISTQFIYPSKYTRNTLRKELNGEYFYKIASQFDGTIYNDLSEKNVIDCPYKIIKLRNDKIISASFTEYNFFSGHILPSKILNLKRIKSKNEIEYKEEIKFNKYLNGNIIESEKFDGTKMFYKWGKNNTNIISEILQSKDKTFEYSKNYEYLPLIGLKSVEDYNGFKTYYEYDDRGRLLRIRNNANQIIKEYEYSSFKISK